MAAIVQIVVIVFGGKIKQGVQWWEEEIHMNRNPIMAIKTKMKVFNKVKPNGDLVMLKLFSDRHETAASSDGWTLSHGASCQSWTFGSIATICSILIAFEELAAFTSDEVSWKGKQVFHFKKGYWAIKAGQSWLFGINTQCIITKSCMPGSVKRKPKATETLFQHAIPRWVASSGKGLVHSPNSTKKFGLPYFSLIKYFDLDRKTTSYVINAEIQNNSA